MKDRKLYEDLRCVIRIIRRRLLRAQIDRMCPECGRSFRSDSTLRNITCSKDCHRKRRRKCFLRSYAKHAEKRRAYSRAFAKNLNREVRNKDRMERYRIAMKRKWASLVKCCKKCGKEFHPPNNRWEYCSKECKHRIYRYKSKVKTNTPEFRAKRNAFLRAKKLRDPVFRLGQITRWTIMRALKKSGGRKHSSVLRALPYSMPQLKAHLESQFNNHNGFTWENYGKVWHVDHIIPQCMFRFTELDSKLFRDCWALSNLRPLEKSLNQRKHAKLNTGI